MDPVFQLRPEIGLGYAAAVLFDIAYPLILAFIARRRLGVGWRYFFYGALIFFLFQLVTRVPAVQIIQSLLAPQLQASRTLLLVWIVVLAITAGLFEEVGRYVGYRWLMGREDKTWSKAVMYGLGHGGLESILLVGGLVLLTLINLIVLSNMDLNLLPATQRTLVQQQLAAVNQQPAWLPLVGAYERLWTVPVQVAFSVIVLQVFRRGSLVWLWLAVLAHALVDFATVAIMQFAGLQGLTRILVPEVIVTLAGLIAIWVTLALREPTGSRVEPAPLNPAIAE